MIKKLALLSLWSLYIYTADNVSLQTLTVQSDQEQQLTITPENFDADCRGLLYDAMYSYYTTINKENVPHNCGLAKIFMDMFMEGTQTISTNEAVLRKANEYLTEYYKTLFFKIDTLIRVEYDRHPLPDSANIKFFSASINRQHAFYCIMHKKRESPIMPESELFPFYYTQANLVNTSSMLQLLRLNKENHSLCPTAIRAINVVAAFVAQKFS